jgi:hypothetical protein
LLPELLADLNTGHNIVATVFEECRSMYRPNGPIEMRPVGEVEFVAGIAATSASGGYPASRLTAIFASIGSFPLIDAFFDAHRTGPRGKSYQRRGLREHKACFGRTTFSRSKAVASGRPEFFPPIKEKEVPG